MQLKTISASSLTTFSECAKRWHAEYVLRTPRTGGPGPAALGTACHDALERYVRAVYMEKTRTEDFTYLLGLFKVAYMREFASADIKTPEYEDGINMLTNWFGRTNLDNVEVLSVEVKDSMNIKTKDGIKKYNYIWDRCDRFEEHGKTIIRVVDYKTIRAYLSPEDVRNKIQAKMYAMAAATQFKEMHPDEIWIQFDLLRYGTIDVKFTREENVETWKFVKATANRIIEMDDENIPETLGPGCMFCVRKANCHTLRKNINGEGIMLLAGDRDAMAKAREEFEAVQKAAKYALEELDNLMLHDAKSTDEIEYETDNYRVVFKGRKSREVDSMEAALIIGPELMSKIGKLNVTELDKLVKGKELTAAQKSLLHGTIRERFGDLKPKVVKKT